MNPEYITKAASRLFELIELVTNFPEAGSREESYWLLVCFNLLSSLPQVERYELGAGDIVVNYLTGSEMDQAVLHRHLNQCWLEAYARRLSMKVDEEGSEEVAQWSIGKNFVDHTEVLNLDSAGLALGRICQYSNEDAVNSLLKAIGLVMEMQHSVHPNYWRCFRNVAVEIVKARYNIEDEKLALAMLSRLLEE
ncbi:MAG: hypothetical protein ABIA47_03525 [bacterium]